REDEGRRERREGRRDRGEPKAADKEDETEKEEGEIEGARKQGHGRGSLNKCGRKKRARQRT
ncbi:hypothetical protein OIV68_33545, partial [Burkholderia pseudomallei]|uniref:hypothetical protein n=1 Tax=Burkholderia pseudomallei TaxID=28450 RepID=UPI0021F72AB1